MAQEQGPTIQAEATPVTPRSGLLLGVERLPGAVDRAKASGSTADDDDGSD